MIRHPSRRVSATRAPLSRPRRLLSSASTARFDHARLDLPVLSATMRRHLDRLARRRQPRRTEHRLPASRALDCALRRRGCNVHADDRRRDHRSSVGARACRGDPVPRPAALFGGLATDVAGARALYELAARCGAIVDHLHGDTLAASTLALQDRGSFFTTLSEVRSRADLVIVFGCEPSRRYPRFYERALGGIERAVSLSFLACPSRSGCELAAERERRFDARRRRSVRCPRAHGPRSRTDAPSTTTRLSALADRVSGRALHGVRLRAGRRCRGRMPRC